MKLFFSKLLSGIVYLRNFFFIILFVMSGNYHQAVEKQSDSKAADANIRFLQTMVKQVNPDYQEYVARSIDSLLLRRGFNGSVLVAKDGEEIYNRSYGFSRFVGKTEEFKESGNIFQLASAGKQFTAISILILQERGLLQLDDPVAQYISDFPYADITIRHLLNHTSGLQNYFYVIDNFWKEDFLPLHNHMLELFNKKAMPLNFTPGRRFSYSNTGYAFLAMLVEKVSGERFSAFVHENIFRPLNMDNSFVYDPQTDLEELAENRSLAFGYERLGRRFREIPIDYIDGITGDKGIFSCTEDLLKWDNALTNNLIISEESKQLAFAYGRLNSGHRFNYGFGYRLRQSPMGNVVYHHGWWRGFRTSYVRFPDNTLIIVLNNTNASINNLDNIIYGILNKTSTPAFREEMMLTLLAGISSE